MSKIRDDVDLKELEKFGFKYGTREKFEYKTKQKLGGVLGEK